MRPESAKEGIIYLIRHDSSGLYKIGITLNWEVRRQQLEVNMTTTAVSVKRVFDPGRLEKELHLKYSRQRLPQTEYFHLDKEQARQVIQVFVEAERRYRVEQERIADADRKATAVAGSVASGELQGYTPYTPSPAKKIPIGQDTMFWHWIGWITLYLTIVFHLTNSQGTNTPAFVLSVLLISVPIYPLLLIPASVTVSLWKKINGD